MAKFARLFVQSIYKWVQVPISLHIGNLDLDRERALQLPVVTRAEWTVAAAGSDAGVAESQNGRAEVEMPVRAARDG